MKTFGKVLAGIALVAGAGYVGHKFGGKIAQGTKDLWGKVFSKKAEAACEQPAPEQKAE